MGLWYGLYLGVITQMILLMVLIGRADWRDLAWKAHVRIKRDQEFPCKIELIDSDESDTNKEVEF